LGLYRPVSFLLILWWLCVGAWMCLSSRCSALALTCVCLVRRLQCGGGVLLGSYAHIVRCGVMICLSRASYFDALASILSFVACVSGLSIDLERRVALSIYNRW